MVVTIVSNGQTKNVTIIRAVISIPLAEIRDLPTAQILTYREVAFGTDKTLKTLLEKFISSGKKRLIFDLRDNPG